MPSPPDAHAPASVPCTEAELAARHADFLIAVAHELRTPVTVAYGALSLLSRTLEEGSGTPAEHAQLAAMAQRNAERLMRLVEDSLDLAAAAAGSLDLAHSRVCASALVLAGSARAERAGAPREVRAHADVSTARTPWGDAPRLMRVVEHLVDNAVSFAPDGSVVIISARDGPGGAVRLTVEDRGQGIAPGQLARLLRGFTPGTDHARHRSGGVGIGLAFCRAVVHGHGGTIAIDSVPGRTVVTCDVPAGEPAAA